MGNRNSRLSFEYISSWICRVCMQSLSPGSRQIHSFLEVFFQTPNHENIFKMIFVVCSLEMPKKKSKMALRSENKSLLAAPASWAENVINTFFFFCEILLSEELYHKHDNNIVNLWFWQRLWLCITPIAKLFKTLVYPTPAVELIIIITIIIIVVCSTCEW